MESHGIRPRSWKVTENKSRWLLHVFDLYIHYHCLLSDALSIDLLFSIIMNYVTYSVFRPTFCAFVN